MKTVLFAIGIYCGCCLLPGSMFSQTWTVVEIQNDVWGAVATSADGSKLVMTAPVTVSSVLVCTSTNSGLTWIKQNSPPGMGVNSVASSADGNKLVLAFGDV